MSHTRFSSNSAEYTACLATLWAVGILIGEEVTMHESTIVTTTARSMRSHPYGESVETCTVSIKGTCVGAVSHTIEVTLPMEQRARSAEHRGRLAGKGGDMPERIWQVSRGQALLTLDNTKWDARFSQTDENPGDDYWLRLAGSNEDWRVGTYPGDDYRSRRTWEENPHDTRLPIAA